MSRKKKVDEYNFNNFGDRIRYVRDNHSLTQQIFAHKLGISKPYVCQLEKGNHTPSEQLFLNICRSFHVHRKWLEEGTGEIWDRSNRTFKGYRLIDDINERLEWGDTQVALSTVAKIVNIDTDSFSEDPGRVIRFADDDIDSVFNAIISIFREGDKSKMEAIKALVFALAPRRSTRDIQDTLVYQTVQSLMGDMRAVKALYDMGKHDLAMSEFIRCINRFNSFSPDLQSLVRSEAPEFEMEWQGLLLSQVPAYQELLTKVLAVVESEAGIPEEELVHRLSDIPGRQIQLLLLVAEVQGRLKRVKKGRKVLLYLSS